VDLDLVLRSQTFIPFPADLYLDLCEKIRDSNIPILVELRDWALLPKSFQENIEQQYEILFSNIDMLVNEPPSDYNSNQHKKKDENSLSV